MILSCSLGRRTERQSTTEGVTIHVVMDPNTAPLFPVSSESYEADYEDKMSSETMATKSNKHAKRRTKRCVVWRVKPFQTKLP